MPWKPSCRVTFSVKYRLLGDTGLDVSEIGFGAWGIGGIENGPAAYGPTDDHESKAALWRAFELGVTFFDTSDLYGGGHSESLIGETFEDVRNDVIIATKVGFSTPNGTQDFSPKHMRKSLDASLRRLRTDYIDLYQLHSPPVGLFSEDQQILATLQDLRDQGKVRALGISANTPDDALVAITEFGFKCIQVNFSLVDQRALRNGLFDLCLEKGVGVVGRTPLSFGFLTGAYESGSDFRQGDHRANWSVEQRSRWAQACSLFETALTKEPGWTYAQTALKFCLSYESVSTVVPGMLTSGQVEENVQASQMTRFSAEELGKAELIYSENEFFLGK